MPKPAPIAPPASAPSSLVPFRYRPEIDGLRALAVMAVLLCHAKMRAFTGGYVGVDVFFVISGYLITSLIQRDLAAGKFSFRDFWARRIRRIVPALALVVFVTIGVGCWWMMPIHATSLGESGIAQALLSANIYFWQNGGYFGLDSAFAPLLHLWSLGVEEQFYLLFPLILWLCWRGAAGRSGKSTWVTVLALLMGSLLLAVYAVRANHEVAAFFLLPMRAWELLLGASLALIPAAATVSNRALREVASWIGLGCILGPVFTYTDLTPFPGLAALPPCIGAWLIIWADAPAGREGEVGLTSLGRLLAWRPVVFVGLISYSLYLWHWPVLLYGTYWSSLVVPSRWTRGCLILASIALAILTWRYVETPFRQKRLCKTRGSIYRFGVISTLAIIAWSCVPLVSNEYLTRFDAAQIAAFRKIEQAILDINALVMPTNAEIARDELLPLGDPAQAPTLLLWGDSQAMNLTHLVSDLGKEFKLGVRSVSYPATPPLLDAVYYFAPASTPERSRLIIDYIKKHRVRHVILAAQWNGFEISDPELLKRAFLSTVAAIQKEGAQVTVVLNIPTYSVSVPKMIGRDIFFGKKNNSWRKPFTQYQEENSVMLELMKTGLPGVRFIDPAPAFLDRETGLCLIESSGLPLYRDTHHLTQEASKQIFSPMLRDAIARQVKGDGLNH